MWRAVFLLLTPALVIACCCAHGQVVINEIMYHDPTNDPAEEFVELYNAGPEDVNLEGWEFTQGVTFIFPAGVTIEAGAYLVLCGDSVAFMSRHPDVLNVIGDFTGRLSNGGERITLCDGVARVVDSVEYDDCYPWPEIPDGGGPSLELIHHLLDNSLAASWEAGLADGGTPGAANSVFSRQRPVADAGLDQFVLENTAVLLNGAGSEDADGEIVSFAWIQTGGPAVELVGDDTPTPRFDAPEVAENTSLTFELTVQDDDGFESSAVVEVIVINAAGSPVSGTLGASAVWDAAGSPYLVTTHLRVPDETTLTIEPGVVVQLFPGASITVNGVLAAEGTKDRQVLFERVSGVSARWGYLRFDGSQGSILRHCVFEYGSGTGSFSSSIPERSALYITDSEMTVERCAFRFFDDYVLTAEDSLLTISHNTFYETGEAINLTRCVATIEHNKIDGVRNGDDAIDINADWVHPTPTPVVIDSNVILRVSGDGIDLGGCSPLIRGNLIHLCADKGISLGEGSGGRIENNILMMNGMGIAIKDGSNPLIVNNTIVKNGVGLSYYQKGAAYGGGKGNVVNSIVWGNDTDVSYDCLSLPNISYSIVGGESLWPGEGNLNENPLFLDADRNDLRLREDSPAVDSATSEVSPDSDFCGELRPVGAAPDMGALERSDFAYDMDGDGVSDDADAFPLDARYILDDDSDALPDEWETHYFGNTNARPEDDPDADHIPNADEYLKGTNPTAGAHASVLINEIHYHPASEDSSEEFIELYNRSSSPADISFWGITDEVLFYFPAGAFIPGHGFALVAKDPKKIEGLHGIDGVYGPYARSLSNAGGVVRLVDEQQVGVCEVFYSDAPPWPTAADGDGPTLELKQPELDPLDPASWRSSWVLSGTPGKKNSSIEGPLVINEFMASPPFGDDWVELYNTTDDEVNLSGFYLSDDIDNLTRYRIPGGTVVAAKSFLLITETECGFGLAAEGETILLTATDGETIWSQYCYSDQIASVSQGRNPDGGEQWCSYLFGSPGAPNPAPQLVGGVVINEVYYHPQPDLDAREFVEIYNTTSQTINLSGWAFLDGFTYHFPLGATLPPNSYLVIGHDPAQVSSLFGIANVLGPFESGRLSNRGERLALHDNLGNLVDSVSYADSGAWPTRPDGEGASLELINPNFDRNISACWAASLDAPTPGSVNSVFSDNIPPEVLSLIHSPTIPTSSDDVLLQARIVDHDGHIAAASVFFKNDQDEHYTSLSMTPETAGSNTYRAVLPPRPDGTLVEFYIRAEDDRGAVTVRPDGAPQTTSTETGGPLTISYLYLIDESTYATKMPLYRLLVTEENLSEIEARPRTSDILLSAGFLFGDEPFYDVGIRYRGQGRSSQGIRIQLLGLQRLHDDRIIRLSKTGAISESLSSEFYSRFGIAAYETIDIHLLINTEDMGYYVDAERMDEEFLERAFPSDSDGNLARNWVWAKFFILEEGAATDAFDHLWNDTLWRYDQPDYPQLLEAEIDVEEWIRWFAVTAVLGDWDSLLGPWSENHLEYERPSDGRIVIFSNDMDCTWISPRLSIEEGTWLSIDPRVQSFLRYPPFRRQYYQEITDILDTEFLPDKLYPLIDDLCDKTGQTAWKTSKLKEYVSIRTAYLEHAIENYIALSDTFSPAIETNDGYKFFTDAADLTVSGSIVPQSVDVRVFRVEGSPVELVANGGFEDRLNGWVVNNSVPGISVALDPAVRYNGRASVRVQMLGGNPQYVHTTQVVNCQPSTQYEISCHIKASGMVFGNVYLNIIDADNGEEYLSVDVPQQRNFGPYFYTLKDCDWTPQYAVFTTKQNTHRLAIRLARLPFPTWYQTSNAEGTVWYDDISLQEVQCGYEPLGACDYDPQTGRWSTTLPLEQGRNVFDFVSRPLRFRPYLGLPTRLCVYRSDDVDDDGLADVWEEESFGSLVWSRDDDPDEDEVTNYAEFLLGTHPNLADTDGDSIPDGLELAVNLDPLTDNTWLDSDGDGLLDPEECLQYRSDPRNPDTDGDGLTDGDEVSMYGTNPILSDTDGDGQDDLDELYAATDPLNPASVFAFAGLTTAFGRVELVWHSIPGKTYQVFSSTDMNSWTHLSPPIIADDTMSSFLDQEPNGPSRFYRVNLVW